MSGAGKSSVLKMLEDGGYFCVDNLPIPLVLKFSELILRENRLEKVALGLDVRGGQSFTQLDVVFDKLDRRGIRYEILFLDASSEVLIKRYKETRRVHPLAPGDRLDKGIDLERKELHYIREQADVIIDTSQLLVRELKTQIDKIYLEDENYNNFYITILSFGFKYGIPMDSDLVFDVRFLPNPYYVPELKYKTGNDQEVRDFVFQGEPASLFLKQLSTMIKFLIPHYISEGKNQLVVSIGCTGGKHRSVSMANALYETIQSPEYGLKIEHRDILRDVDKRKN